jgi:hypothetical protein
MGTVPMRLCPLYQTECVAPYSAARIVPSTSPKPTR